MRREAVALAVVLTAGACTVGVEDRAQVAEHDAVPFGLLEAVTTTLLSPVSAPAPGTTSVCFLEGGRVVPIELPLGPSPSLDDLVDALADPPESPDRSLRTSMGESPLVAEIVVDAGVAQVDLRPDMTSLGGDEQLLAVAQLVCTLTGQPGVGPVAFTLDGAPVDVPRGDGSLTSGPVSRDDYAELLGVTP